MFLSILLARPDHANALYSLAVMYQKVGEKDNLKAVVTKLNEVISDKATLDSINKQFPVL